MKTPERSEVRAGEISRRGIRLDRGQVGTGKRKIVVTGASDVDVSTGRIARDEDEINIHAGGSDSVEALQNPDAAAAAAHPVPNIHIDLHKDRVGRDESTANIHVVVNQYIDPRFQQNARLWDLSRSGPGIRTRRVYIASRENILEFVPEESGGLISYRQRYRFAEPVERIRSLTPLDVAGEIVLLVGSRRRVGVWQPLAGSDSELGFYRCRVPDPVRGGFNSVTISGGTIYGAHFELGLIRWEIDNPDNPDRVPLGRNEPSPDGRDCVRAVKAVDDHTLFVIHRRSVLNLANGHELRLAAEYVCPELDIRRCPALDRKSRIFNSCRCERCLGSGIGMLSDFVVLDESIFAVSENGILIGWDRQDPGPGRVIRNFGSYCFSMNSAECFGGRYLVIGSGFGVHLVPVEPGGPEYFFSYPSGRVNHAFVASDRIIAEADDLKTLLVWNTENPGSGPVQVINLKDQYGHRGQSMTVLAD